tara:strand:+ start:102 stop:395 length:294 start_codon:yes stop_codon:yes gene_type:complete
MKKLWKVLLGIGAVIFGIFAMSAGRGSKKQFKKDLKDNKKKIDEIKTVLHQTKKSKKKIKKKIVEQDEKINETKVKIKNNKNAKNTISEFKEKYRSK